MRTRKTRIVTSLNEVLSRLAQEWPHCNPFYRLNELKTSREQNGYLPPPVSYY